MTIHPDTVGIDVCKHHFDIFDPRRGAPYRVANTLAEAKVLAKDLAKRDGLAVFEATGRYDANLRLALSEAGTAHARVNPEQARNFAKAIGKRAKTDAVDARMLAELGCRLNPRQRTTADADREHLGALSRRRDQLVSIRQQERVRRVEAAAEDEILLQTLDAHLAWLDEAIAKLDARIREWLQSTPHLMQDEKLMRSIPGVGPVCAAVVLASMPEIGTLSPKTVAALGGLAPYNNDTGCFRGKRSVRGGRKRVRDALYMAAVSASRTRTSFGEFYRALRRNGKSPKLAFIALARKILVVLNAVIRDKKSYQPA